MKTSADKIKYTFTVLKYIIIDLWESIRSKKYYRKALPDQSISEPKEDIN
mgnify:CR=1 FL=1